MSILSNYDVFYYVSTTSFGKILVASTEKGICLANFVDDDTQRQLSWLKKHFPESNIINDKEKNIEVFTQLEEYFEGSRKSFDLKIHLIGTPFQEQVWNVLKEIPYNKLLTYKDVSTLLGDPKKCRAVGGAVGKNPIVIIVPCHRVVGSNGKMTGFSSLGGIDLKKKLLKLEKSI